MRATSKVASADGRENRTQRSRRALCEACLDLVQEGVLQPSADQIAERAGLSRRSVFNHFSDLAALYDDVVEAGMRRCASLHEQISGELPVAARVAKLAEVAARFFEATTPLRRSMKLSALAGPVQNEAARVERALLELQRDSVAKLFSAELTATEPSSRAELVEALSAAVSPAVWEHLRLGRALSLTKARAVMQRSLVALLRDAGIQS